MVAHALVEVSGPELGLCDGAEATALARRVLSTSRVFSGDTHNTWCGGRGVLCAVALHTGTLCDRDTADVGGVLVFGTSCARGALFECAPPSRKFGVGTRDTGTSLAPVTWVTDTRAFCVAWEHGVLVLCTRLALGLCGLGGEKAVGTFFTPTILCCIELTCRACLA